METKDAIRHNYLLRDLSEEGLNSIAVLSSIVDFSGGDVIIRQFDKKNDLFIILEGSARINTFSGDMLAELGPGSVVGEISLVDEKPRSATVVSVGSTKAAKISSEALRGLLSARPDIAATIYKNISLVLCARIRNANMQLDGAIAK